MSTVSDNGVGRRDDGQASGGPGMSIVEALSHQHIARTEMSAGPCRVTIPSTIPGFT
jgi:two-component sensor histidine kinase